ncbi:SPAC10F6.14c ABC1 family protein C10F6.14c [Candida maltosa Xu316]|uniref:Putative mitochondrial chaperonin n=1 Tax=Candida maltosa (strain Xu316) TaxID=1245528 RepID=M3JYG6_CANMX|nr:putative mitochondrial chaperonin [Candida maltosa Xu316]
MFRQPIFRVKKSPFPSTIIKHRQFATHTIKNPRSNVRRYVIYPTAITVTGLGIAYYIDNHYYSSLLTRSVRAIYVLSWIVYQYGFNSQSFPNIDDLHELASSKLLNVIMTNKGLYIKLGQAIANQGPLFPLAYQKKFPMLYDMAPAQSWIHVDATLKDNLGDDYETEYFSYIDHEPIASASIAQVHFGKLKSGEKVAIKVQHDYIKQQLTMDLMVYRLMSMVYERVFNIPLSMFTKSVAELVSKETNFILEAGNSEKLTQFINNDSDMKGVNVRIPKTVPELTTRQVLTAEWISGFPLTHKEILLQNKLDLTLIMKQYLKLFGRQIFEYGFVHSDPHPGNLIARFDENGKQQLVLLDHGLYITLPESFRKQYCELWRYLFSMNKKGIETIGKDWGISQLDLFSSVVQLRPVLLDSKSTTTDPTQDTRNISQLFRDFIGDEKKFPSELPFLARTMRMMQNLNQSFGSPVNRINLLTKESVNALLETGHLGFGNYWDLLKIKIVLMFSEIVFYFVRLRQLLTSDSEKSKGLEDYIEMYMQNTAKSLGMEWI